MQKEFICMEETTVVTQKKIRTWISSGYDIEIISQSVIPPKEGFCDFTLVVTSLWRSK